MSMTYPVWSRPSALLPPIVPGLVAWAMAGLSRVLRGAAAGIGPVLRATKQETRTRGGGRAAPVPGPSAAARDRRRQPREPMACGAMLELAGRAWAVNLLDLSEGGAGVQAPSDVAVKGAEGVLVIDTAVIPVRVVAVDPGRLGLAFGRLTPPTLATIRDILSEPRRPSDA
jgi:hypothetical protein